MLSLLRQMKHLLYCTPFLSGLLFSMNELVHDNIPAMIASRGGNVRTEILMGEGYYASLKQKLTEEVGEFLADDNAEEIADILEVLHAIARYKGDRDV